jgi:hypothetical protein
VGAEFNVRGKQEMRAGFGKGLMEELGREGVKEDRKKELVENKQGIEFGHSSRSAISASPEEEADRPKPELR